MKDGFDWEELFARLTLRSDCMAIYNFSSPEPRAHR